MSKPEHSIREHIHSQKYTFRFQSETLAPLKDDPQKRPRFSIEEMIYVSGVGWEILDINAPSNPFLMGILNYIRQKELQGYKHTGLDSVQYKEELEKIWGKPECDW